MRLLVLWFIFSNGWSALALDQQCANPLEKMVSAIRPSCTKGLDHLGKLLDKVINFDGEVKSRVSDLPIQRDLIWTSDTFNETQTIADRHLKRYESRLLSLTREIAEKQQVIKSDEVKLEQLTTERGIRQQEVNRLNSQLHQTRKNLQIAEQKIQELQQKIKEKKRRRIGFIFLTIFTLGLGSPALIINERDLQRHGRDRDSYKNSVNEYLKSLYSAQDKLNNVRHRQYTTEQAIERTRISLSTSEAAMKKLKTQDPLMKQLGVQIKSITTFLSQFQAKIVVVNDQQKLLLLIGPLIDSLDDLIQFLGKSQDIISLLAEKTMVKKIRNHITAG